MGMLVLVQHYLVIVTKSFYEDQIDLNTMLIFTEQMDYHITTIYKSTISTERLEAFWLVKQVEENMPPVLLQLLFNTKSDLRHLLYTLLPEPPSGLQENTKHFTLVTLCHRFTSNDAA